ncbi:enoyl-CoA hydratase/isomerase family protein [Belliella kenyensis]|uniref:Enoyl-CoA hydratase/isomerase family protein n=1 Tax=Belliella kenyensis TaxID=1472724 RepID=A0ABV8EIQ3_9BACT|nr:enoyl-CoA hydratase-related protein [Belliella kenyensis]MCH7402695.1 enoyl-CoA hydratase-related protein [Belliella kenyensis]MDN3603757.1 enoyl-CoA hydratase-related protein [Belliella kenyensis]
MEQAVSSHIFERIGYLTLNRPEKRNALNQEMVSEMRSIFSEFETDDAVKVIVIRAEGKVFCSGADLASLQQLQSNSFEENLADSNHLKELFQQIYTSQKVVIAQVQGHALAGGCGLVTVCDFAYAVPEAKFGYTEVKIGFVPAIVKVFLLRKIGEGKAKQLLLGAELLTAKEAQDFGLINWLTEADQLEQSVYDFAQKLITQNSGVAMGMTKQMIAEVQEMSLEAGLSYAAEMNAKARESQDCKQGISAFLNKEPLIW